MIEELFSTCILSQNLTPPESDYLKMISFFETFIVDTISFYKKENKSDTEPLIGLSQSKYNMIHLFDEFNWLNSQINKFAGVYLSELGVDISTVDIYAQKSWPVSNNLNNFSIIPHKHTGSVLSAVYYVEVSDPDKCPLVFENTNDIFSQLPLSKSFESKYAYREVVSYPNTGKLIIFPSHLLHYVAESLNISKRFSVSYDLMVTGKKNTVHHRGQGNTVLNPDSWKNLSDPEG
jgi:uncharacterized protein (TIGR02466 family)